MDVKALSILIAEDDRDQREILTEVLTYEGYRVLSAASPQQCAELLASNEIHILLMDVNGAYGPEVARALASLGRSAPLIFVVSGDCRAEEYASALDAAGVVSKPYELAELLEQLKAAARHVRPKLRVVEGGLEAAAAF